MTPTANKLAESFSTILSKPSTLTTTSGRVATMTKTTNRSSEAKTAAFELSCEQLADQRKKALIKAHMSL